ncbi:MAG: RICIN domain-containing protein [Oscillospiraceae bacterium]
MNKKKWCASVLSGVMCLSLWSGVLPVSSPTVMTANAATSPIVEYLDRGINAVGTGSGMLVSWRFLASDPDNAVFKLYRDNTLIYTSTEKANGATCFLDKSGSANSNYKVECYNGNSLISSDTCQLKSSTTYYDIKLDRPGSIYTPNDMSVGDVDGDGVYELFVKWDPNNSKDNSQKGKTDKVYIDCYKLDGKKLWRIDLGVNIRAGAHYTQFFVADFDLDGKAEMTCKTADGTVDGVGKTIGDGSKDYRNSNGYVLSGNEYYTLFDGATGAALDTVNYEPARGTVSVWGDSYGNRVDRFWGTTAYLDGVHPCVVTGRGYYTRLTATAYKVENKKLVKMWAYDSGNSNSSSNAYGDGNHNSMAADVDGDGKQEIVTGAAIIDDNGKLYYTTKQGHGDALHLGDLDPTNSGMELWICHEEKKSGYGVTLVDCDQKKIIFHNNGAGDTGRCCADNVWAGNAGAELWGNKESDNSMPVKDAKGNTLNCRRPAINFLTYWDGDLEREILDGYTDSPATISKMTGEAGKTTITNLLVTDGFYTCNTTKGTPCLSADIFGDWREELIVRKASGDAIRIYCTDYDTDYRIQCLMHDPQYRTQVSAQQTAYNQPPHTSFFLGTGYDIPARPTCTVNGNGVAPAGKAGATIDTAHKYMIQNVNSGLYMAVDTSDNNVVQLADGLTGWTLEDAGNGYYRLYSETGDGKTYLLDLDYGKADNGTNIHLYTDTQNDAQLFKFVDNGDGSYTICTKNTNDESCIGVLSASKESGANAIQWACNGKNDQKWKLVIKVDPVDGNLIQDMLVKDTANYLNWNIDTSLIANDAVFGDRDFTYTALPAELIGSEAILTACNSKNVDADLATFTAGENLVVYIAMDARQENIPAWLSSYTKTNLTATTSNDVTFNFYTKQFKKGETVTLGTNGGAYNLVNYTAMVKPAPLAGNALVKNLQVNDCESFHDWTIAENATTGSLVYGDREVTLTQLPTELQNTTAVRTACDSKNLDAQLATFTAGANETVYILMDSRVTTAPAWLNDYTKTNLTAVSSNDVTFTIYSKVVSAGDTVTLGTNGQSSGCVNYTVLVKSSSGNTGSLLGDVNAEGTVNVSDVVLLQKHLHKKDTVKSWKNADMNGDGVVNVIDLALLKKKLLQ